MAGNYTRFLKPFLVDNFMAMPKKPKQRLQTLVKLGNSRYNSDLKDGSVAKVDVWRREEIRLAQDVADDSELYQFFITAITGSIPPVDHRAAADLRAIKRNCDRETMMITRLRRWS